MHRILRYFLLFVSTPILSQYSIESSVILGGNSLDEAADLALNADSTIIFIGGRTFSTDGNIPGNNGGADFWVMKQNVDGTLLWTRNYGGASNDDLATLMPHTDGGVIVFGTTRSEQGANGDLIGLAGAWLFRTNSIGAITSGKIFGGDISENAIDAVRSPNGNITMAIEASSPTLDDQDNNGVLDTWIVHVNSAFDLQWSLLLGGSRQDMPAAITTDQDGNIYVAANSQSDLPELEDNAGALDVWIFKISPDGDVLWQQTFGGSENDIATDILIGPDSLVYVMLHSASEDGDFDTSYGMQDLWLLKMDSENGDLLFSNNYGGSGIDANGIMTFFGNDHLMISATSNSDSVDLSGNKGFNDVWTAVVTLDGQITYQMNYGGSLNDLSGDVVYYDSTFFLINTSLSTDKNVPDNNLSQQDLWLLSLDANPARCSDILLCLPDTTLENELFPPATDVLICVGGCTAGMDPGPSFLQSACEDFNNATAFYKLTTDTTADLLTLSVQSDEFNKPRIALMRSGNCTTFIPEICGTGEEGFLLLSYIDIEPLTTYVIAVSDADGTEGRFELCATSIDVEFCNEQDRLYVNNTSLGSPPEGPFRPGELVQICYELLDWNKLECNGFQGLIPTFGPGWDPEGFDLFGMPLQVDSMLSPVSTGTWDWHQVGDVRYNISNPIAGYQGGQGMPAGWYFTNTADVPPNDGPDQTPGDIFSCLPTNDTWKVCFTLPVEDECEEDMDLSISMRSFSDGELGVETSLACAYDQPEHLDISMVCCLNPQLEIIQNMTACSGDTILLYPETNILPPVTYSWVADPDIGIEGASAGTDLNSFYQILTNETGQVLNVNYIIWAEGYFCETDPEIFTIQVLPRPTSQISISGPDIVCSGERITLNFESTGTPPFAIELLRDNQFFANVLSEQAVLSIEIDPVLSGRFRIGDMRDAFCTGSGLGFVNVTVKPVGSAHIDTTICEGGSIVIGTEIFEESGSYIITLDNGAENNCDSIVSLSLTVNPSSTEIIEETICTGDTLWVLDVPYTESTQEIIAYEGPLGCLDYIDLNLTVTDTFTDEINQTICAGDTLSFGGVLVFETGVYSHVEEPQPGCFAETILHLTVLPQIFINDLEIMGDDGNNTGAIFVEILGGTPPHQFSWSSGQQTESILNIESGDYSLTVTDGQGCMAIFEFNVPFVTSTENDPGSNASLRVWPTLVYPGQEAVWYAGHEDKNVTMTWWSANGLLVHSTTLLNSTPYFTIPGHLHSGIYFVKLKGENNTGNWQKMVVR